MASLDLGLPKQQSGGALGAHRDVRVPGDRAEERTLGRKALFSLPQ